MAMRKQIGGRIWRGMMFAVPLVMVLNCSLTFDSGRARQVSAQSPLQNPAPVTPASAIAQDHPLTGVLRLAKESRERLKDVEDYQCRFSKRDVVGGKVHAHSTWVKFRRKPMSVYMRFEQPNQGREVIYVEGQNGGKLLAHETGLLGVVGTVALLPTSARAMSESRHSITEFGMEKLLEGAIAQWEAEARFAASETEAKFYPKAKLDQMECQVIETRHRVRRREFAFYMTRLYLDNKTMFPVRMEQYGFPTNPNEAPPLIEEYTYFQIQTNRGFTDQDFHPANPQYGFK